MPAFFHKVNDGMHALILSRSQVDLFEATLDRAVDLQTNLDLKFHRAVDDLPAKYDYATYHDEEEEPFGTHYVSSATFGGLATMRTTAWHVSRSPAEAKAISTSLAVKDN